MGQWERISDYTDDPQCLAQSELQALKNVWHGQRERLAAQDAFQRFNEKLKREWAIETGLIERLYVLDRGVTQLLIDRGIHASLIPNGAVSNPELVVSMISDHETVVEGIFDFVKGNRGLSTSYIKEMHALITRHQDRVEGLDQYGKKTYVPLQRGKYKELPNNPVRPNGELHEYCPPEHVAAEMDRLIEMHQQHTRVSPEVEAAWLHHRFAQIHPFQDGNGRVARALATLVFVKSGWFPLVVRDRDRGTYIDALEAADGGDLGELVKYFAGSQRDEFVKALSIAADVLKSTKAEDAIRAVKKQLQRRKDSLVKEWNAARITAKALHTRAVRRLREVEHAMRQELADLFEPITFSVDEDQFEPVTFFVDEAGDGTPRSHYFRFQIVETAKKLDYFANSQTYRSWVRLVVKNGHRSELLISFHGIGHEFQGVVVCSACWFQKVEPQEEEGGEVFDIKPVSDKVFQINYKESREQAEERFLPWLEQSIVRAIELWQASAL